MTYASDDNPTGTINSPEDLYVEGGADLWFGGVSKYSPDPNGYYWGITGTAEKPVYSVGCYENLQMQDNLTVNDIRCDTIGVVGSITRRNFVELTFDLKQIFPLSELKELLRWSSALSVPADDVEYAGIGEIDQNDRHKVYFSKVYDETAGDWVSVTGHRVQFEWNGAIQFRYGNPWMVGIRARLYADSTMPSAQRFATVVRYDPSAI